MWSYDSLARIEARAGKWYALVTLSDDGKKESFFLKFNTQPVKAPDPATNYPAVDAAVVIFVANRNEQSAMAEFENCIANATFTTKYQTAPQFAARFRAQYLLSTGQRTALLAYWIIERINDGTFTDTQVRNAFNLTSGQYTTLKSKFITLHDDYVAILAAQGE